MMNLHARLNFVSLKFWRAIHFLMNFPKYNRDFLLKEEIAVAQIIKLNFYKLNPYFHIYFNFSNTGTGVKWRGYMILEPHRTVRRTDSEAVLARFEQSETKRPMTSERVAGTRENE